MNSCRYPEAAENSALFQKLVAGEWPNRHHNLLVIEPTKSDSYCKPRYIIRMPSHFDAGRETAAAAYAVHPRPA
jgi:hypothetical protein